MVTFGTVTDAVPPIQKFCLYNTGLFLLVLPVKPALDLFLTFIYSSITVIAS